MTNTETCVECGRTIIVATPPRAPVTVERHEQQVALRMAVHYLRTNAKNDDSVESDDMLRSAAILEHLALNTPPARSAEALIGTIDAVLKNHPRPLPVELLEDCRAYLATPSRDAQHESLVAALEYIRDLGRDGKSNKYVRAQIKAERTLDDYERSRE
jgi:hypothetical protein